MSMLSHLSDCVHHFSECALIFATCKHNYVFFSKILFLVYYGHMPIQSEERTKYSCTKFKQYGHSNIDYDGFSIQLIIY